MTEDMKDGDIVLNLDRPRKARITLNSLCRLEAVTGGDLRQLENRQMQFCKELLWAGLVTYDRDLKIQDVGDILDEISLGVAFREYMRLQKKVLEGQEEIKAVLEAAGTGIA